MDLASTTFTWDQLAIDLKKCEYDIDTIIAPLHFNAFHLWSQFFTLAGRNDSEINANNFPAGMVITSSPWVVILTLDFAGTPDGNSEYAKALHATAKQLCEFIGNHPGSSKLRLKALPDDSDKKHGCLTRSQNQLVHADRLTFAFKKLAEAGGIPFQLRICNFNLKALPETVYGSLTCMFAQMRIAGLADLEEQYMKSTILHIGVDIAQASNHLLLAKAYSHERIWDGQPAKFSHYPCLGKLGQGFGGITVQVKDFEHCEAHVFGWTFYQGPLKRELLASKVPARKWLGLNNDQLAIAKLQPEFEAWRAGLMDEGQIEKIGGARLELYTSCCMRNWHRHRGFLIPIFRKILESMTFKMVKVVDYVHQFHAEYSLAIASKCFQCHESQNAPAFAWQQLGCQRLRMLIGWSLAPEENKKAYQFHEANVLFTELRMKPSTYRIDEAKSARSIGPVPVLSLIHI